MKNLLITTYYSLLVLSLASLASFTLYQGSQVVNLGQKIAEREQSKRTLAQEKFTLQQELTEAQALVKLNTEENLIGYVPISKTKVVVEQHSLAALP
jgi:hypothetical protein